MSIHKKASLVGTIESLLQAVEAEKTASHTEAGGYEGQSSHPVADADDKTQVATEGERSSENTSDVKADVPGQSVDEASEGPTDGGQDSVTVDIGLKAKSTGDDPAHETSSVGAGKDDPGSDHPARTDNDDIDGEKYSSAVEELSALAKQAEEIGSEICSMIAVRPSGGSPEESYDHHSGDVESKEAAQAGYDLAGVFDGYDVSDEDKYAADAIVVDTIGEVVSLANTRAEKTAQFFNSHFNTIEKKAIPGMYDEADTDGEDAGIEMPGEEGGGEIPPELLAALQGGGGEEELGGGGEIPPELLAALQGGGGEEELGGGGGEIPPELLAALQGGGGEEELGGGGEESVGPEEEALLEALLQGGGGEGGEVPGAEEAIAGMGGEEELPEMGGEGGGEGEDLAILEQVLSDSGVEPEALQEALKEASAPRINLNTSDRREKYAKMRDVILELVNRSR